MRFFPVIFILSFTIASCTGRISDPFPGSGGRFLATPSNGDIQSGKAIFSSEKCSTFILGKTHKTDVVEKLGRPSGWSTEHDGTSVLEYDYVEPTNIEGMRQVITTFFSFDRSMALFKMQCPGFDQAGAPKDVEKYEYKNENPVLSLPANQTSLLKINNWFSKDRNNVYLRGKKIIGADQNSFRLACRPCEVCGEDKNRCYWFEHAVPCNCSNHDGGEFPSPMLSFPEGKSFISYHRGKDDIQIEKIDGEPVAALEYTYIESGRHVLDLTCTSAEKSKSYSKLDVDLKQGRIYRLKIQNVKNCSASLGQPTRIRGKIENPEISIQIPDHRPNPQGFTDWKEYKWSMDDEIPTGTISLTFICREVSRERMREGKTEQSVKLIDGHLYQVEGRFTGSGDTCEAHLVDEGS